MEAATLLRDLAERGVHVSMEADGEHLHYEGPTEAVTPGVLAELRRHKPAILAYLQPRSCADCGAHCGSDERCAVCAAERVAAWAEAKHG